MNFGSSLSSPSLLLMKPKKCKTCSKEFTPFNSLEKYCSYDCKNSAPKKERKKKTSRQVAVKNLDDLCSKIIRAKEPKCVICGSTLKLTAGHVFSRRSYATRWDFDNIHTQCWSCNFLHTKDQWPYFDWYINRYGKPALDALRVKAKTTKKFTTLELIKLHQEIAQNYPIYKI